MTIKIKTPCLQCKAKEVDKKFYPFCGKDCAAAYAVAQFDRDTIYCEHHGWVMWSSTDPKKKPKCLFEHKAKS
jgi:hypothetical protein